MSTKIPDENFDGPTEINQHPCLTASRWLNAVPELVTVTRCCQDVYNTSLVIIDITLVGTFFFTPTLKIISVDGDTSYGTQEVVAPIAIGHQKNSSLPINTNCNTFNGTLVFDFGKVIPNYTSAQSITFELFMQGTVPTSYGVSFPNQSCSDTYLWNKGVLPSPVNLEYDQYGNLSVIFEYKGGVDCSCNIQCSIPSGVSSQITFCPGERQSITLYQDPDQTDPYTVLLQLSDALGNTSNLEFQSLFTTTPKSPIVLSDIKPKRINVFISTQSANGIELDNKAQYQIFRYAGNKSNYKIWKDWSSINWNSFVDYDVIPGQKYGYAVRFKGLFGETTKLSNWSEVTT
jgi:hypothetical protein